MRACGKFVSRCRVDPLPLLVAQPKRFLLTIRNPGIISQPRVGVQVCELVPAEREEIIMRALAITTVALLGYCCVTSPAPAAESDACKICRDYHQACVKAHSQAACKSEYDICMRHCRKK